MSPDAITGKDGAKTVYTTCSCNCGGNQHCVIKAHVKDGKVIAVEPDDRYNKNIGREDAVLSESELIKNQIQRRPCVMGLAFHRYIYNPKRILYPMKRAPGTERGEGQYIRISWDEALDTIGTKMRETRERFGPYSIMTPYTNFTVEYLFSHWGAGVTGWGACSCDSARLMSHVISGDSFAEPFASTGSSAPDMLANAKVIVLWGWEPTIGHHGPAHQFAWFINLARERGIPVIIIDPRYTCAASTLADQWIPIKPGTDHAMFMAMAQVLFEENLYDKDFVAKHVEPNGFAIWRDYVMGIKDGIPKTPEWAETKCAVPAQTIRELARLISARQPAWLWAHWSVSRKSDGEQMLGAFAALQAMMGNWGKPGSGPTFKVGPIDPPAVPYIPLSLQNTVSGNPGNYAVPKLYRAHNWAEAIVLLDKLRSGELSEKDYRRMVGWKADPAILKDFNPKFLFHGGAIFPHATDFVSTTCDSSNVQVQAVKKMDFMVSIHSILTSSTRYADMILPVRDQVWEDKGVTRSDYGGFASINYCPEVVEPPGEVKSWVWIYTKIAEKLGVDPHKFFKYYTTDANWENDWERYQKDVYKNVITYYQKKGIGVPSWEEFTRGKFINCDELEDQPFTGWDEQIKQGKPFRTKSGKIEFHFDYIAQEVNRGKGPHYDTTGRHYEHLPADWGEMKPSSTYRAIPRGMDTVLTNEYPLLLLTAHSRYRVHYLFWEHEWLKDHVYRHRIWINIADAKARGIKDNDMVMAYNDRGKVVMPAYVTARLMPGLVLIHAGGKVQLDKNGVDFGASPSTLLGGEFDSCLTPSRATNLVQVIKYAGESK